MRLHRRLRSQQPVHRIDLWGRVDTLLPILKQYMHSSKKYYVAVLLVALRQWPQARAKWLPAFYELTAHQAGAAQLGDAGGAAAEDQPAGE